MSEVIAANFASVADGANSIRSSAQGLLSMLADFNTQVRQFVDQHWQGEANNAFAALQANWNSKTEELTSMLNQAAGVVLTGNEQLQATDRQLASLF